MIFVIDDDEMIRECVVYACGLRRTWAFSNTFDAMFAIGSGIADLSEFSADFPGFSMNLPELIFMDALPAGPDGFTFLNELASYSDTAKIPVVLMSLFDFKDMDLSSYGVVGVIHKDTMQPKDIRKYVEKYVDGPRR